MIRNGRAWLIDATLVPQGQILLHDGCCVPLPTNYAGFAESMQQPVQPAPQGQPTVQGQTAPQGQTTIPLTQPPAAPGTVLVPPQAVGINLGTVTGNPNERSGKTPAGVTAMPAIVDPKNPGAGATTVGPNTRTTGGENTGATTKSAVSGSATSGGNTDAGAKR